MESHDSVKPIASRITQGLYKQGIKGASPLLMFLVCDDGGKSVWVGGKEEL